MTVFELGRLRHMDLLALLYLRRPEIHELPVAGFSATGKPFCSKETLVYMILECQ